MLWSLSPQEVAADFSRKKSLVHPLVSCAAQWIRGNSSEIYFTVVESDECYQLHFK